MGWELLLASPAMGARENETCHFPTFRALQHGVAAAASAAARSSGYAESNRERTKQHALPANQSPLSSLHVYDGVGLLLVLRTYIPKPMLHRHYCGCMHVQYNVALISSWHIQCGLD